MFLHNMGVLNHESCTKIGGFEVRITTDRVMPVRGSGMWGMTERFPGSIKGSWWRLYLGQCPSQYLGLKLRLQDFEGRVLDFCT